LAEARLSEVNVTSLVATCGKFAPLSWPASSSIKPGDLLGSEVFNLKFIDRFHWDLTHVHFASMSSLFL
jgi:hypothetical protein